MVLLDVPIPLVIDRWRTSSRDQADDRDAAVQAAGCAHIGSTFDGELYELRSCADCADA